MARFDLRRDDVDWTLYAVYWLQSCWMVGAGFILTLTPERRLGNSYQFILAAPSGQTIVGGLYLAVGVVMMWAMARGRQGVMACALTVGGLANWAFGVLLGAGALFGPTGAVGWWFSMYVGAHMLLQSVLLRRHRAAP